MGRKSMSEWWRDFFNKDYINLYGPEDTKKSEAEAESIIALLGPSEGSRILDLCCGYGRHAIGLAKKGYDLIGLDLSPVLLKKARDDMAESETDVVLVRADMRDIPFKCTFDYVINIFTAFGYFDNEDDDQRVMNGVCAALRPGGAFLMDTVNREWVLSHFRKEHWEELEEGKYALDEREFDPLSSRIRARTICLGEGEKVERHHSMRFYTLTEMTRMVEAAGMKLTSAYGHLDGRRYWLESPRMVVRAEKPFE
jgi:SAM-dependent methyltransferase